MTRHEKSAEQGVILINVLSVLALTSAVVVALLTIQDISIERSTKLMDAAVASHYALGGETSAISALRRDAEDAPESDHFNEPWAAVQQSLTPIEAGFFSLTIEDEQSRFNLNNLRSGGLLADDLLDRLLRSLNAPPRTHEKIVNYIAASDGLTDLFELQDAGVEPTLLDRLAELVCVLPEPTDINLNTASEPVLAALLGNRASARLLISRRDREGLLTPADLANARVLMPPGSSFHSDYYRVATVVQHGVATQTISTRLRRFEIDGRAMVEVWSRRKNAATGGDRSPLL